MDKQFSLKEHLFQLENQLLKPEIRTSPEEITKLLAEDFFEFGSSGNVWYKKDCIANEGLSVRKMTIHHFELFNFAPDVALATYQILDETSMQHTLRSSIWKYIDGQCSFIKVQLLSPHLLRPFYRPMPSLAHERSLQTQDQTKC